jgi:hypothetical protein
MSSAQKMTVPDLRNQRKYNLILINVVLASQIVSYHVAWYLLTLNHLHSSETLYTAILFT